MKTLSIQTNYISNINFNFFKGFIIPFKSMCMEFNIQGTHGTYNDASTNWETLEFSIEKTIYNNEKYYYLKLYNPSNCAFFKFLIAGAHINDYEILPEEIIPKRDIEIKEELKQKKIVFLGLARDTDATLTNVINKISKIGTLFKEFRIYIFENDSTDNTVAILKELKNSKFIEYFSLSGLDNTFPDRTIRLSFARNYLLHATKNLNFDYVVCFDTDGVFVDIPEISFTSCFKFDEAWDGTT